MAQFNYNKTLEDYLNEYYQKQREADNYQKNKPGAYNSQYSGVIDDYRRRIANRDPFSYDPNNDVLYQQYKNQYSQLGKLAMQDTMGQAAQLTGGYGNSYANMVGQQAYQNYMRQASDKIPELAQLAYNRYAQEGQDLYNQLAMYQQADDTAYGRYRDSVGDFYTQLNYLTDMANTAYNRGADRYNTDYGNAYNMWRSKTADEQYAQEQAFKREQYEYQKQQDAANAAFQREKFAYQQAQDAAEAQRKAQEDAQGYVPDSDTEKGYIDRLKAAYSSDWKLKDEKAAIRNELIKAGMSSDEANEYLRLLLEDVSKSKKGGSGGAGQPGKQTQSFY